MVAGAASLAQRARWRSTPLLASASAKAPSSSRRLVSAAPRSFSILAAASASPKTASSVGTLAYNSATFTRFSVAYPAQSTLLAGKPFSSSIAYRRLSFWPSSSKSQTTTDASTVMSDLGNKQDEAVSAASEPKLSTESTLEEAGRSFQDELLSAQETASDAASKLEPKASELSTSLTEQFSNVDPTTASTVTEAFSEAMGVKAGELAEFGLNHWASPPGWITNLLETVGTTTGLPWWGTIVATTVALRLFIAPINIAGQKNAIRLANIQPEMKRNMDDIKHFKAAGDQMQMQKVVMDTRKLLSDNNANPIKSFAPLCVQLPLMFSYFVALERIAKSGSESFAHGGPSWCPDLTIADPTYILPAISTLATFAVAELGFKLGTTGQSNPEQAQLMKYIFRGFIPIMAYFSTTFPSGVLVYWATTNVISLIQLGVLQIPVVRQWVKFPKRIRHPKNPYQQESKGFMDKLKAARDRLSDSSTVRPVAKPAASSTNTIPTSMSASESRSDALKEILDDKAAYEATPASKADAEAAEAAQRNRERVLKARKRRARQ
ncbi:related to OXA1-cytochrome oxidase biogenesis protein, mitochondrial [Ustilago bromivora]|uniref:Related to OXA1 - cytochrome oxidase biogenesis protein, mitochondrial n=1 Tax=Ustilago bromivora TaxID=307758 RepID=A0A1K0H038_9BASI|nr:related to OXA1-cytochrome oxidase biogenesis protein, mitochondrial [Ustilago bromivora]SYW75299.1 related to OXA1 - cytochrome oxidase biogenesis protein, mitochondrial [Ustilago bromivora]